MIREGYKIVAAALIGVSVLSMEKGGGCPLWWCLALGLAIWLGGMWYTGILEAREEYARRKRVYDAHIKGVRHHD